MKNLKCLLAVFLAATMTFLTLVAPASARSATTSSQGSTALERGYRTGYSDGYNAGYKDVADQAKHDYQNKAEYQKADRAYAEVWGPIEDYRDGYQQGYEAGYNAGYDRRPFDSSIPTGFKRRGVMQPSPVSNDPIQNTTGAPPSTTTTNTPATTGVSGSTAGVSGSINIPRDATLVIQLENPISTNVNQRNDPFSARVVEPQEYAGAIVEGRISRLQRAGKVKGSSELQLSFEQIRM